MTFTSFHNLLRNVTGTRHLRASTVATGFALIGVMTGPNAKAQITYDGFNYTLTGPLAGNTGWAAVNSGTAPTIAAGNLLVAGLSSATGNQVNFPGGNFQEADGATGSYSTGTVYYSFAFQITSLPSAANYTFSLGSTSTTVGASVWLQASSGGFQIGLSNRSASSVAYDGTIYSLNETIFLVGSYSFISGSSNDTSSLWVNPAVSSFAADIAPSPTLTALGGTDLSSINRFQLRGAAGSAAGVFDELRIGSSWASVTPIPEPSTYAASLGIAALIAVLIRRKKK